MRTIVCFAAMMAIAITGNFARAAAVEKPAPGKPAPPPQVARRTAFIIDASGSMKDVFPRAIAEVAKAIDALGPNQAFIVVIAKDGKGELLQKNLTKPTEAAKQQNWELLLKQEAVGTDGVAAAVQAIEKQRPDAIWFVSDGDIAEADITLAKMKAMPGSPPVNTSIAFLGKAEDCFKVLTTIAHETGGVCVDAQGNRVAAGAPAPAAPATPTAPPANPSPASRPSGPSILKR
jgi:hypothetical protein